MPNNKNWMRKKRKEMNWPINERILGVPLTPQFYSHPLLGKDAKLDSQLFNIRSAIERTERHLQSTVSSEITKGLAHVREIAREEGVESGLYGPLYELFTIEPDFMTAVEATAGNA